MKFDSMKHPVSWFRDRYRERALTLRPPFQRKPVWASRQKCFLVESILLELPVPEVFVQQTTTADGTSTYAVVDGQQRIRTVLQFVGADLDPDQAEENQFVLDKLDPSSKWAEKSFSDLSEEERKAFYGYMFSVRYLETDREDEIRDMFTRLNRYLAPLKSQELRNAMYTGPFLKLANALADNEYWAENHILDPASIRRMGDIEFTSELLIGVLHGPQGGSGKIIDSYYAQYEDYEGTFPDQARASRRFHRTLLVIQRVLPNVKGTRWANKTDFYSLFVAIASLLRTKGFLVSKASEMQKALMDFAEAVEQRFADERARVPDSVARYVRAVEKGANDKKRRGDRHLVLLDVLGPFFGGRGKTEQ